MSQLKAGVLRAAALLCVAFVGGACSLQDGVRGKETMVHMRALSAIVATENPGHVDDTYIEEALIRHDREGYELDGWGNRILVEVTTSLNGDRSFRVTSYGRDGVSGSCCAGWIGKDWDGDAVLEDGEWLQVWN